MTSLAHFEKVAGVIELPGQAVIGGRLEPARFGRTFHNVTPRNGTVINGVTDCEAADVDLAVAAARRAFDETLAEPALLRQEASPVCARRPHGAGRRDARRARLDQWLGRLRQAATARCMIFIKYADLKWVSITIR